MQIDIKKPRLRVKANAKSEKLIKRPTGKTLEMPIKVPVLLDTPKQQPDIFFDTIQPSIKNDSDAVKDEPDDVEQTSLKNSEVPIIASADQTDNDLKSQEIAAKETTPQ